MMNLIQQQMRYVFYYSAVKVSVFEDSKQVSVKHSFDLVFIVLETASYTQNISQNLKNLKGDRAVPYVTRSYGPLGCRYLVKYGNGF